MQAVFVDGAGRTKELAIAHDTPCFYIPCNSVVELLDDAQPSLDPHQVFTFERLGRLPDGRTVFGQSGIGWQLWYTDIPYTNALAGAVTADRLRAYLDEELTKMLANIGASPVRILYDVVESAREFDGQTRRVWGVGVPRVH